jgi:hypothetical protein
VKEERGDRETTEGGRSGAVGGEGGREGIFIKGHAGLFIRVLKHIFCLDTT